MSANPSLIAGLSLPWDLRDGPYRAFFPQGKAEGQACRDLHRQYGTEEEYRDVPAQWAACQDTRDGRIVACYQIMDAAAVALHPEYRSRFPLEALDAAFLPRIALFASLCQAEDHRHPRVLQTLLTHCFIELLRAGAWGVLLWSRTDNFAHYKRLGWRPIAPLQESDETTHPRIALIGIPDRDYLSIIHSPLLPMMKQTNFGQYKDIVRWYQKRIRQNSALRIVALNPADEDIDYESHHLITEGMSDEGRSELLDRGRMLRFREGEVVIDQGENSRAFGYVHRGLLRVVIRKRTVILLGEGDVLGEMAFILDSIRTARVLAASPEAEVVLFSEDVPAHLSRPDDRTLLWRNLARIVAQRLIQTNQMLK